MQILKNNVMNTELESCNYCLAFLVDPTGFWEMKLLSVKPPLHI